MTNTSLRIGKATAIVAACSLGFGGLFVGSAAFATEDAAPTTVESDAPATQGGTSPELEAAIIRDLGITVDEYLASADAAQKLSAIIPQLSALDGYVSVSMKDGVGIVTVNAVNPEIDALALSVGATVEVVAAEAPAEAAPADSSASAKSAAATLSTSDFDVIVAQLSSVDGVISITQDGSGNVLVRSSEKKPAAEAPVDKDASLLRALDLTASVQVDYGNEELSTSATTDLVGGAGYAGFVTPEDSQVGLCSIGFPGWSSTGAPVAISAGHCTADGTRVLTATTVPTGDDAYNGTQIAVQNELGTFGFSQFGGPGNTADAVALPGTTDVSIIQGINPDLNLKPAVTKWSTPTSNDLAADTTNITAVGDAVAGQPVCKSGRTTGYTCATVTGTGVALIDDRWVTGFSVETASRFSDRGDSGGSMFSGGTAIGLLSGGDDPGEFTWGAGLNTALAVTDGVTVQLFIAAPAMTTTGDVETGGTISGTAPAGSTVMISIDDAAEFAATTDANGNWSFSAPATEGEITFTAQAVNGFNKSETKTFDVNVVLAPLSAPVFTTPNATSTSPVAAIAGTGTPGATVTLAGDAAGTAEVGQNGSWSIEITPALSYGNYSVTASQSMGDQTSPTVGMDFSVVPMAPVITSPADGAQIAMNGLESASGTGIDGATVTVYVDGVAQAATATVVDGQWTVMFDQRTAPGQHTISASQTIDEMVSELTSVMVTVAGAQTPPPGGNGDLPDTGSSLLAPSLAGGFLLAGGAALMLLRRRQLAKAAE